MVTLWDAGRQLRLGWRIDYGDAFVSDLAFAHAASGGDPVKLVVLRDIVHDNDSITSYLDVWTVGDATRFNLNPPCARPNCTEYPVLRDLNLALALSPSNDRLAVTSSNGSVLLYDLGGKATTHATLRPSSPSTDTTYDAAFDRTGTMLAAVAGKNLVVWRLHGMRAVGKPIVLHSPSSMLAVAFSPVSPLVATGGRDGRVELWNLTTRKPTSLGFHTGRVNGLAFSPDGATLATAGDDGRVILWDVEKRKNLGSLRVRAPATSVAFSADGRTLAVGTEAVGGDGNIFLWDLATREQLGEPYEGLDSMWAVAFSPDGTMVAGGNADGSVYLWGPQAWATKVAPLAANLCAALGRYLTRDDWNRYVGGQPKKTCPS
jgi:WD40 repeat protein